MITRQEFDAYLSLYYPASRSGLPKNEAKLKKLLEQMITERLIVQEAEERGLDQDPAFQAKVNRYKANLLSRALEEELLKEELSEEKLKAYYEDHSDEFTRERAHARQILIRVSPGANAEDVKAAEKKAEDIIARLQAGESFDKLAREFSEDHATGRQGGDMGMVTRDELIKPLADAVFSVQPGEIKGPVRTPYGFHVLKLEAPVVRKEIPFQQARPEIERKIRQTFFRNFKQNLREKREIQLFLDEM